MLTVLAMTMLMILTMMMSSKLTFACLAGVEMTIGVDDFRRFILA